MTSPAPTLRQGLALLFLSLFVVFLLACPALARKDMQIATQGDPGDGNLSPESVAASSSTGGHDSATALKTLSGDFGGLPEALWILYWVPPVPGVPVWLPLPTPDQTRSISIILSRERGCDNAY